MRPIGQAASWPKPCGGPPPETESIKPAVVFFWVFFFFGASDRRPSRCFAPQTLWPRARAELAGSPTENPAEREIVHQAASPLEQPSELGDDGTRHGLEQGDRKTGPAEADIGLWLGPWQSWACVVQSRLHPPVDRQLVADEQLLGELMASIWAGSSWCSRDGGTLCQHKCPQGLSSLLLCCCAAVLLCCCTTHNTL
ncbi:hypothetical protein BD289DRAFT_207196 [Coniella lustricola]|uniref:Uncharacterized protein n=1 Tax=Coniella lustricola TaxID=2025994 RepID=A0A2T2ZSB3_9PEZI|nr:hypothetical protein BD289DRAFT_207196 [Coniella lustricola]